MDHRKSIVRFLKEDKAAASTEYALLAALIALFAFLGMQNLGQAVNSQLGNPTLQTALGS